MIFEELHNGNDVFYVGLVEVQNHSSLETSKLLEIAKIFSKTVLAVQLLASENIAGVVHLLSAAQNALNAWRGGYSIARSLDVELALYASAQNQIERAFDMLGLSGTPAAIVAIVVDANLQTVRHVLDVLVERIGPEVLNPFVVDKERMDRIMTLFMINDTEIEMLSGEGFHSKAEALGRCIASRVSSLAITI